MAEIVKGTQLNKDSLLNDGLYPVMNGGVNPSGFWNEYNVEENRIAISQGGASAGYVNYMETKFWAGAHCFVISSCVDFVNYKFLYYVVKMYQRELMQSQYGAGIPSLSAQKLSSIQIPIPPIAEQERIVKILDRFESLCNDISSGIPAEIKMRRKQYEFYRDRLLAFDCK